MPTRNINLTERLDHFVAKQVSSGRYGNASEVVREGLRLMEQRTAEERAKLRWLRVAVKQGQDEIERGDVRQYDSIEALATEIEHFGEQVTARKTHA